MINSIKIYVALAIVLFSLSGCSTLRHLTSSMKPVDYFITHETDQRILYEPGAKYLADMIEPLLQDSIAKVEKRHYRPFKLPVKIYVCQSEDSFFSLSGSRAKAIVTNKVLLSPRLFEEPQYLSIYLTHELSHLHLYQQTGVVKTASRPAWFNEGLATYVSDGGGAHLVSECEAVQAIKKGSHFLPNTIEDPLNQKNASNYGLSHHMFYRQSMMFVEFMHAYDQNSFRDFLLGIQDGQTFAKAFNKAYPISLEELWQKFFLEVNLQDGC